jgi:hypothetical protein
MRRILVCTGILGGGTALVFALAALTAVAFPQGTLVAAGWNGNMRLMDERLVLNQRGGWRADVFIFDGAVGRDPAAVEVAPMNVESP